MPNEQILYRIQMTQKEIRINQLKQRNRELERNRDAYAFIGYVEWEQQALEEIKLNEQIIKFLEEL